MTYRTLLEKFNSKYSKLNLSQKNLLREYINNISNTNSLKEYIAKQIPAIKEGLNKYSSNLKDKVVKIKLKEAYVDSQEIINYISHTEHVLYN